MSQAETINTDFLPIIYDIIRSVEKETYETTPKPHEIADSSLKIPELRTKLQQCREQIQKLPGIDYTKEEQLRRLEALHEQNRAEYKKLVVNWNIDLCQSKIAESEPSLIIKEHDIQMDEQLKHLTRRDNVMKLSAEEVKDSLLLIANLKTIDILKYNTIIRYLDEKCAISMERWPLDISFYIIDAWFIILGQKIFKQHTYAAILSIWTRRVNKCSKASLILMLYYVGMDKKAPPFLMEAIKNNMENYASDFSDEEWAITCVSFFKTSTPIHSNVLLKKCSQAAENLLLKDDYLNAISILKCLRLSKYYDSRLLGILKQYILKKNKTFNLVTCTNFLATFASQNEYDYELFSYLEGQGLASFQIEKDSMNEEEYISIKTHPSIKSRVKDIARFLWAMTSVGHTLNTETVNFFTDSMRQRFEMGEFDKQIHILIDYSQSLALAGYYPYDILSSVLKMSTLKKINFLNKSKPRYQLYFVQRSTQIEAPEIEIDMRNLFNPIPKDVQKEIQERQGYDTILKILNQTSIKNYTCCYLIPHIMISGVFVSSKRKSELPKIDLVKKLKAYEKWIAEGIISKQVKHFFKTDYDYYSIEILDPNVCVNQSTELLGLMKTKIRQLNKININVIALSVDEINKLASSTIPKGCEDINELIALL
ncbi:mediator complex subunit 9 [Caerostris extrusa]|uniref:Mediator of RNA polymerase II transcription subunit 9 n=1 Tax=Caerostris extrusa TaxID=172846 RepID=A0AAV4SCZ6_CAEEX|nr:mediator complex subunit 9 [Caerostris extrusa]